VNEYPLFVPYGDDFIAAVLTVPESEPRALVLLLQQGGIGRSNKNRTWTRLAARLAERDLATARMDYLGLGDSTGKAGSLALEIPPVGEAMAVLETTRRLAGVEHTGVVGHCYGGRTAVAVASRVDSCVTAALAIFGGRKMLSDVERPQAQHGEALVRRLGRKVRGLARRDGDATAGMRGFRDLEAARKSTDMLLMLSIGRSPAFRQFLEDLPPWNGQGRGRIDVVELPTRWDDADTGVGISMVTQQPFIDTVTEWMDANLPGGRAVARDTATTS
jgi:pimeloyl-ACP methyl ester carboxylesterase